MSANDWELLIAYIGRYKPDTLLIEWISLPPHTEDILGRILSFKCIKTLDLGGSYFFSSILNTTTLNSVAKLLARDDTVTALRLSCIFPSEPVTAATPLNLYPGVDMESVIMMIAGNGTLKKLKLKFRDSETNQYRIVKAVMQSYSEIEVLYVAEPPPEHIQKPPKNGLEMDFDLLAEYLGVALINRKLSTISFQGGLKYCHKKDVPITFNSPEYYSPNLFSSPS